MPKIALSSEDLELFEKYWKRRNEIVEQLQARIQEILKIVEKYVPTVKFKDVSWDTEDGYEEFCFCDDDSFKNPDTSEVHFQSYWRRPRDLHESIRMLNTIGWLDRKFPFKWLNMSDGEVEAEITKIIEENRKAIDESGRS
jgi:hypothetical protein